MAAFWNSILNSIRLLSFDVRIGIGAGLIVIMLCVFIWGIKHRISCDKGKISIMFLIISILLTAIAIFIMVV